ncbi:MAG: hypothetical protein WCC12_10655 [Anaerolineales bacterium]
MKATLIAVTLVVILFLVACQSATPAPLATDVAQIETQAAAASTQTPTAVTTLSPIKAAQTAGALTAAARTPFPTSSGATFEVSVPAKACWMNSEVNVLTGQTVRITAFGTVNTNGGKEGSNSEPDGQKYICGAIQCPVQGVGYGALVGRLEDLKPFFVGRNVEFTAMKDGQLYFTVNDWECDDNSGTFILKVTVE